MPLRQSVATYRFFSMALAIRSWNNRRNDARRIQKSKFKLRCFPPVFRASLCPERKRVSFRLVLGTQLFSFYTNDDCCKCWARSTETAFVGLRVATREAARILSGQLDTEVYRHLGKEGSEASQRMRLSSESLRSRFFSSRLSLPIWAPAMERNSLWEIYLFNEVT